MPRTETAGSDKEYDAAMQEIVDAANIPEGGKEVLWVIKNEELLRAIVDNVGKRDSADRTSARGAGAS